MFLVSKTTHLRANPTRRLYLKILKVGWGAIQPDWIVVGSLKFLRLLRSRNGERVSQPGPRAASG
jgi:hypothetical protein